MLWRIRSGLKIGIRLAKVNAKSMAFGAYDILAGRKVARFPNSAGIVPVAVAKSPVQGGFG